MIARLWYLICQTIARFLAVSFVSYRVFGTSRIPARGGVILASNHQSYLDPILIALPLQRGVNFMARDTLFRFLPFRLLISTLGAFPVQRGTADMGAIKESLRRLKDGKILLVFPEGTRSRDGSLGRMRGGIGLLASRAEVPVVPVLIQGSFRAWPRGSRFPHPSPVSVRFGHPLSAEAMTDPVRAGVLLEEAMAALLREGSGALPPPPVPSLRA